MVGIEIERGGDVGACLDAGGDVAEDGGFKEIEVEDSGGFLANGDGMAAGGDVLACEPTGSDCGIRDEMADEVGFGVVVYSDARGGATELNLCPPRPNP